MIEVEKITVVNWDGVPGLSVGGFFKRSAEKIF
jgi:hypothetical protein